MFRLYHIGSSEGTRLVSIMDAIVKYRITKKTLDLRTYTRTHTRAATHRHEYTSEKKSSLRTFECMSKEDRLHGEVLIEAFLDVGDGLRAHGDGINSLVGETAVKQLAGRFEFPRDNTSGAQSGPEVGAVHPVQRPMSQEIELSVLGHLVNSDSFDVGVLLVRNEHRHYVSLQIFIWHFSLAHSVISSCDQTNFYRERVWQLQNPSPNTTHSKSADKEERAKNTYDKQPSSELFVQPSTSGGE